MTSTITKFYIVGNLRIILANTLPHDANHIPYMLPSCDFQIFFKTQTVIKAIAIWLGNQTYLSILLKIKMTTYLIISLFLSPQKEMLYQLS